MASRCDFPFAAVAFDMDGTLLDSMSYWRRINIDFLQDRGIALTDEVRADLRETSNRVCARRYADAYGIDMTVEAVFAEMHARMLAYYLTAIEPKPGALAFVKALRARGVRVCVATASPATLAVPALSRHGLYEDMEFLLSAQDEGMRKEEGVYYDTLVERLALPREKILFMDDALYAVRAAHAAGLTVWGVRDPVQQRDEAGISKYCARMVDNFYDIV